MQDVLITGGSGFFGGVLKRRLLAEGFRCVNIDLVLDSDRHERLASIQGDLRDQSLLSKTFACTQIHSSLPLRGDACPRLNG